MFTVGITGLHGPSNAAGTPRIPCWVQARSLDVWVKMIKELFDLFATKKKSPKPKASSSQRDGETR